MPHGVYILNITCNSKTIVTFISKIMVFSASVKGSVIDSYIGYHHGVGITHVHCDSWINTAVHATKNENECRVSLQCLETPPKDTFLQVGSTGKLDCRSDVCRSVIVSIRRR